MNFKLIVVLLVVAAFTIDDCNGFFRRRRRRRYSTCVSRVSYNSLATRYNLLRSSYSKLLLKNKRIAVYLRAQGKSLITLGYTLKSYGRRMVGDTDESELKNLDDVVAEDYEDGTEQDEADFEGDDADDTKEAKEDSKSESK